MSRLEYWDIPIYFLDNVRLQLSKTFKKKNYLVPLISFRFYATLCSGFIFYTILKYKNKINSFFSKFQAKIAARRYARLLQKLGFNSKFRNFRVVNVLGTCSMPWAIKIVNFSERYKQEASYEPELHPGVTYKLRTPKATLKIFSTGSITVTGTSLIYFFITFFPPPTR